MYEFHGVSPQQLAAVAETIGEALDGRCLTRQELTAEVVRRVGPWAQERLQSAWGDVLRPAAYTGRLCFGPSQGAKVAFVRADRWIGEWEDTEPHQALAQVLRRYLAAPNGSCSGEETPDDAATGTRRGELVTSGWGAATLAASPTVGWQDRPRDGAKADLRAAGTRTGGSDLDGVAVLQERTGTAVGQGQGFATPLR